MANQTLASFATHGVMLCNAQVKTRMVKKPPIWMAFCERFPEIPATVQIFSTRQRKSVEWQLMVRLCGTHTLF
jgi:hypothetical protein